MNKHRKFRVLALFAVVTMLFACLGTACSKKGQDERKKITAVADLDGSVIGVQLGTTGDIFASDYEGDDAGTVIDRFNKGADAIQALISEKIDCVIIDEQPAKAYVAKNSSLSILEEEFAIEDYAICVAKENKELTAKINAALATLKQEGTIQHIIDYYIGEDGVRGVERYEKKDVERENGTLIVATNAAFEPYEYYDKGVVVGIDVDIMQAVCDILGMNLQIDDMEFDSIIAAVASGKADVGAAGMTVTEDRLKNIDFTDTYTTSTQVIIVKTGDGGSTLNLAEKFKQNFIDDDRYQYLFKGLLNTLLVSLGAIAIGTVFGVILAIIRSAYDRNGNMRVLNLIAKIYITIIRGTPAVVQLLIIYYVILVQVNNKLMVAVIAFGLNSAAYVAEVVRSGIMSVDIGQFEAGRSLGLDYRQTMLSIIMPQAIKNILPALCNEFISLIKETSISGYIGFMDLTKGGDIIRSITYEPMLPLFAVALAYLAIILILTAGVRALEKKLRNSER